jgi:hypothetical protein
MQRSRDGSAYPHGQMSMVALALTIVAWVLGINATWGCRFLRIDGYIDPPEYFPDTAAFGRRGVGLFSYESLGTDGNWYCFAFTEDDIENTFFLDSSFKAAMAMGVLTNISFGIPMLMMLVIGCVRFNLLVIKSLGWLELFGSLCAMLTMVMFSSNLTKPPFNGTFYIAPGLAIAASLIGFCTGLVILRIPKARDELADQPPAQAFAPGTMTTTETEMPDGTKKITKTVVNPDGSQTVTETIVQAGAK